MKLVPDPGALEFSTGAWVGVLGSSPADCVAVARPVMVMVAAIGPLW